MPQPKQTFARAVAISAVAGVLSLAAWELVVRPILARALTPRQNPNGGKINA